jgi:arabinogalactan endo-1,4-beta-galactosidase
MNRKKIGLLVMSCLFLTVSCQGREETGNNTGNDDKDSTGFAKGADASWLTEMEHSGISFYDAQGRQTECLSLLRSLGMNAIRLRVWVNPPDGWCNAQDVLVKAWRAKQLGMRVMIDFHYSDTWADPSQQTIPAAWSGYSLEELKQAVGNHTREVLTLLKSKGITPEWVQVGNETGNGFLWDIGKASLHMAQYAALNNAGYEAVKEVFPSAMVIVHLQEGDNKALYRWLFDGLKQNGGKWDVIGMSLYPEPDNWEQKTADCLSNMEDLVSRYGCRVMVCEVGMAWNEAVVAKAFLTRLISEAKALPDSACLGVFYWEPEAYGSWKGYQKGSFDQTGKPTEALDAFGL